MKKVFFAILDGIVPVGMPLPTSYFVYSELIGIMPAFFAGAAALSLEVIGFRSIGLAYKMKAFNDQNTNKKERDEYTAPIRDAWMLVIAYLVVSVSIVLLINFIDNLGIWLVAVFPFLGLTGGMFSRLSNGQDIREQERSKSRKEATQDRAIERKEKRNHELEMVKVKASNSKKKQAAVKKEQDGLSKQGFVTDEQLIKAVKKYPEYSHEKLGALFGIQRQAISPILKKPRKRGAI